MRRPRLIWRLLLTCIAVSIVPLAAVSWFTLGSLKSFHVERIRSDLNARAMLLRGPVLDDIESRSGSNLADIARKTLLETGTRLTVVSGDGSVVADSSAAPESMDSHAGRLEIVSALRDGAGFSVRRSTSLKENRVYLAVRLDDSRPQMGVLRLSHSMAAVEAEISSLMWRIAGGAILMAIIAVIASLFVSYMFVLPIEQMRKGAERLAGGDYGFRMIIPHSMEMNMLAEAINRMAAQLDERLKSVERQKSELDAVLSGMSEGVIAVDLDERILGMNNSAAQMLGLERKTVAGRILQEAARSAHLQKFLLAALSSGRPEEGEIILHTDVDRTMRVQVSPLKDGASATTGAVIVLSDVTGLRRLENVRRDFVANVSHELKTPITAIKGSVETLLDGAVEDRESAFRFLKMISRQSDRLSAIIEDLLLLSRIEQEGDSGAFEAEEALIARVLQNAVSACAMIASDKLVRLDLSCPEGLVGMVNPPLLEQAVVNLIENAVKYSPQGASVDVRAAVIEGVLSISVTDEGCGIEEKHLDRIFERFYRVDKARSRQIGGTGLGLAIVKHIIQAHGGTVAVKSEVGKGSVFTVRLTG